MIVGPPTCGYTAMPRRRASAATSMHASIPPQIDASGWNTLAAPPGRGASNWLGEYTRSPTAIGIGLRAASQARSSMRICGTGSSKNADAERAQRLGDRSAVRASWNQ